VQAFGLDLFGMAKHLRHCPRCGRRYGLRSAPAAGAALHCRACGGPLAEGPGKRRRPARDPFLKGRLVGVRLLRALDVRPDRRVYLGAHAQMRGDVRVEVFPESFAAAHRDHVHEQLRRAAATRDIQSPYVLTVMDIGHVPECYYIFAEYLTTSVRAELETRGTFEFNRVLAVAEGALNGLAAVAAAGAVHGNATPEGILLSSDGSTKLDHLGTTPRREDMERLCTTDGGAVTGPAFYAAPELDDTRATPDIRADLYSLGATLYEMLTGAAPFRGATAVEVRARHTDASAPDPRLTRPDTPPQLCRFVARLLARNPADRPAGPGRALDELREVVVDLSRSGRIRPVASAMTESDRSRSVLKWTGIWTLVSALLVAASIAPIVLMVRGCQHRKDITRLAALDRRPTVLVLVRGGGPAATAPLPEEEIEGIHALLSLCTASQEGLELHAASRGPAREVADADLEPMIGASRARHVLIASHAPGVRRRKWDVTFLDRADRWSTSGECSVEFDAPAGLAPLERILGEVLERACAHIGAPKPIVPLTSASSRAWGLVGRAVSAERSADLASAVALAEEASAAAPDAAPFALLAAFLHCAAEAEATGVFPEPGPLDVETLPPAQAELACLLSALAREEPERVKELFGRYLMRFPRSVRGYYLLGLWRLRAGGRQDDAISSFRRAAQLDAGYGPATAHLPGQATAQ